MHFPATGVDRFCDECRRPLLTIDDNGAIHVATMVTMLITHSFGEHGPEEVLVTQVWCRHCYPTGVTHERN